MNDSENLIGDFQKSAEKQITRMQEPSLSTHQVHVRTPTNTSSKIEAPSEELDMFDYIPVRYEHLAKGKIGICIDQVGESQIKYECFGYQSPYLQVSSQIPD